MQLDADCIFSIHAKSGGGGITSDIKASILSVGSINSFCWVSGSVLWVGDDIFGFLVLLTRWRFWWVSWFFWVLAWWDDSINDVNDTSEVIVLIYWYTQWWEWWDGETGLLIPSHNKEILLLKFQSILIFYLKRQRLQSIVMSQVSTYLLKTGSYPKQLIPPLAPFLMHNNIQEWFFSALALPCNPLFPNRPAIRLGAEYDVTLSQLEQVWCFEATALEQNLDTYSKIGHIKSKNGHKNLNLRANRNKYGTSTGTSIWN